MAPTAQKKKKSVKKKAKAKTDGTACAGLAAPRRAVAGGVGAVDLLFGWLVASLGSQPRCRPVVTLLRSPARFLCSAAVWATRVGPRALAFSDPKGIDVLGPSFARLLLRLAALVLLPAATCPPQPRRSASPPLPTAAPRLPTTPPQSQPRRLSSFRSRPAARAGQAHARQP